MISTKEPANSNFRPKVYTSRGAAQLLGVTGRTVQNWVSDGIIPAIRTAGGHIRITQEALDLFQTKRIADSQKIVPRKLAKARSTRIRVLLVEDNTALSALYDSILKKRYPDADVKMVSNGFEALLEIGHFSPDILVTDLDMPDMDGIQMLRALYNTDIDRPKTTVVITGLTKKQIKARGGIPAETKLIHKPLQPKKLLKLIDEIN